VVVVVVVGLVEQRALAVVLVVEVLAITQTLAALEQRIKAMAVEREKVLGALVLVVVAEVALAALAVPVVAVVLVALAFHLL
jgi:hypothetical protein